MRKILIFMLFILIFSSISYALDSDNDSIEDNLDNCPNLYNPDQLDLDHDNIGFVCDEEYKLSDDFDQDGIIDSKDKCPYESSLYYDANLDGCLDKIEDFKVIIEQLNIKPNLEEILDSEINEILEKNDYSELKHLSSTIEKLDLSYYNQQLLLSFNQNIINTFGSTESNLITGNIILNSELNESNLIIPSIAILILLFISLNNKIFLK